MDLRTRTRENVRVQIAEVAFNVFAERGFDAVTATEVAEAAGISRASFFRYFDSKEDAVFVAQEELGVKMAAALRERPGGEDAWTALRRAAEALGGYYRENPAHALARLRLIRSTPKLRAHQLERQDQWRELIVTALAERLGLEEPNVQVEALVSAALGALRSAAARWVTNDGSEDLVALTDEAFSALAEPFPLLRP
jgi:AcrR family transcriptional regulator